MWVIGRWANASTCGAAPGGRAATALLLLCPQVPLLFQGEEWAAASPFLYFCDLGADFAQRVRDGRRHEFVHDPRFHGADALVVPDPLGRRTAGSAPAWTAAKCTASNMPNVWPWCAPCWTSGGAT